MPTAEAPISSRSPRSRVGMDAQQVLHQLSALCEELAPGGVVPRHTELMQRYEASERSVRWALEELRRQGKIVRRHGARTVVADPNTPYSSLNGHGHLNGGHQVISIGANSQTIVAISEPDGSLFDRALQLLVRDPDAARIAINCRLMQRDEASNFELPTESEKPLGYILFGKSFAPLAQKLQSAGHRVVLIGSPPLDEPAGVPNIYCDHEEGGYLVVRHLLELGHRHFVFQGDVEFKIHPRWHGMQRALDAAKAETRIEFIDDKQAAQWMKNPDPVRGFLLALKSQRLS